MRKLLLSSVLGLGLLASFSAHSATVYVSNEKDDTVSVIDSDTMKVVRTFEVGQRPRGIILSHDHKKLFICTSDDDTVEIYDAATEKKIGELPSGADPELFALHPDNRRLYIANEDDALTTVVDVETSEVIAQIDVGVEPEGMAVSHNGKWAITTSETTNMVHWIDTAKNELFENTLIDARPRYGVFEKDDSLLWASSEIGGTVSVIETENFTIKKKIKFAIKGIHQDRVQPVGMRLTSDGKYAFVALGPANHVAVVNRKTYEVEKYILVGRRVWHMEFLPGEKQLLTTNGVSGDVTLVDVEKQEAIKSVKVGRYPWGVAVKP
ncbi:Outer membrane protein [Candidatus Terasakiella magnetica]|uniref:Outer membrane protein n=1 Tax=Candidatus Terasakiella magnetica TaxID=1867952 RepID=A0A1C3RL35_9PROT|nr:PQQ-dependent catabolism-associated beta-propeller protein [Candidatus Terasakiella magnetica]SCA57994.1 Outer membrane protein [Candidatus Terasakiella magnetica]